VPEAAACDQGSGEDGAARRADAAGNHATCVMASHADQREAHSQQAAWPMAATTSRRETGAPEGSPGHKLKEMGKMTSSQNAALLAQWADMFGGNISLVDDFVTNDFATHVAPLPWKADVGETAGREAFKQWLSGGLRLLIPDMRFSADVGPIADEDYLVIRWKAEGTYNGGFPGSSPDAVGRTVAITGTDIVRIEDGKFAEYWLDVDSLFFLQQIGVKEVPALA
jgi:hypothetical protein